MPTNGVESLDAADLSAIATMLRLAMRSSVMNILRTKSRAESDSRHKPNGATHGSPAFRASSVPLFESVAHRQHAFRWLRQRSGRLPIRSCILDGEAIVSTADLLSSISSDVLGATPERHRQRLRASRGQGCEDQGLHGSQRHPPAQGDEMFVVASTRRPRRQGRAAGDRAFGRPVTGEAATLRIGRGHAVNPLVRRVRPSQE